MFKDFKNYNFETKIVTITTVVICTVLVGVIFGEILLSIFN